VGLGLSNCAFGGLLVLVGAGFGAGLRGARFALGRLRSFKQGKLLASFNIFFLVNT
jgi:hypothetical protein